MKKIYILAAVAAVVTGLLLFLYLNQLEKNAEVPVQYETVVVAARDVAAYETFTEDMVTTVQLPLGSAHAKAARGTSFVVGMVTENPILAGEQIITEKLKKPGETGSGMAYIVPEGMRAVTFAVDTVSGVASFLRQGDYVDLFCYCATKYDGGSATELSLVQNVLIAALGDQLTTQTVSADGSAATLTYSYITVIVTPEQAMRIVAGYKNGTVTAVLRATGDHEHVDLNELNADDLRTGD